jgi:hypothetical protein
MRTREPTAPRRGSSSWPAVPSMARCSASPPNSSFFSRRGGPTSRLPTFWRQHLPSLEMRDLYRLRPLVHGEPGDHSSPQARGWSESKAAAWPAHHCSASGADKPAWVGSSRRTRLHYERLNDVLNLNRLATAAVGARLPKCSAYRLRRKTHDDQARCRGAASRR